MSQLIMTRIAALVLAMAFYVTTDAGAEARASGVELGGHFALTAQDGRRFGDADLAGRPYALFFGFTNCPEVCPTTLAELSLVLEDLGEGAGLFTPVFVTVDPERDTPERLKEYLDFFDKRIVGLSGTAEQTAALARLFKATYAKVPTSGGDYTMEHTAIIYLMDETGTFFDKIEYGEDRASQLRKIRALIERR